MIPATAPLAVPSAGVVLGKCGLRKEENMVSSTSQKFEYAAIPKHLKLLTDLRMDVPVVFVQRS